MGNKVQPTGKVVDGFTLAELVKNAGKRGLKADELARALPDKAKAVLQWKCYKAANMRPSLQRLVDEYQYAVKDATNKFHPTVRAPLALAHRLYMRLVH